MSKPLTELVMTDPKGRMTFLKRNSIAFLSGFMRMHGAGEGKNLLPTVLKVMSLEEVDDRFRDMYGNTGTTIYAVAYTETMHFFEKVIAPEVNKRISEMKA